MQHLPVYSDKPSSAQRATKYHKAPSLLAGSRSLTSMLPSLISTGVITLVVSAILRLIWIGFNNDFFAAWMEAWLTTWPIAFPLVYISKPLFRMATKTNSTRKPHTTINNSLARRAPPHAPHFR
ncbi:DUF2798 domain-containing protein [Undibacterium sp. RuRC25W]|uniref:DUF2798 domain-containing protein n=1 Tax=Undibacterium sp. RuRC25W TaxID=3413047 RepID=UPI003BF43145